MTHEQPKLLLEFLAGRDEPCPVCGYSLRDLAVPRCPECGSDLALRVGSPQLRVGPWALAIISFALALGFDGVVALVMIVALVRSPAPIWQPYGVVTLFAFLAIAMLAAILALAGTRHDWNRWPVGRQWIIAAAVFGAVGALHACVGAALALLAN